MTASKALFRSGPVALATLAAAFTVTSAYANADELNTAFAVTPVNAGSAALPSRGSHPELAAILPCGIQWRGTIHAGSALVLNTYNWPHSSVVAWTAVSDTNYSSGPAVGIAAIATQQTDSSHMSYWLRIENIASTSQVIEARFCVLH